MKNTIKALILDLDGTTVESLAEALPSKTVIQAIQEAKQYAKVACATGRSVGSAKKIIQILELTSPCIVAGGSQIVDPISFEPIWEVLLSKNKIEEIIKRVSSYDFFVKTSGDTNPKISVHDASGIQDTQAFFLIGLTDDEVQLAKQLLAPVTGINCHVSTSWEVGKQTMQITHEDASKKHALEKWLSIERVNKQDVMCIGDSYNDLPLFEVASLKIAMGNANNELKELADWIAPSVDEDGVAVAIKKFILNEK